MSEFIRNEGSRAAWRWQEKMEPPKRFETARRGVKAGVQAALMLSVAWWLGLRKGHLAPAVTLMGLATFVLVSALWVPRVYAAFERLVAGLARGAGNVLTWLLLVPFFYAVFVPGRLILLLRGRDPLHRKFPSNEPTYWVPWKPDATREHYFKQYR